MVTHILKFLQDFAARISKRDRRFWNVIRQKVSRSTHPTLFKDFSR